MIFVYNNLHKNIYRTNYPHISGSPRAGGKQTSQMFIYKSAMGGEHTQIGNTQIIGSQLWVGHLCFSVLNEIIFFLMDFLIFFCLRKPKIFWLAANYRSICGVAGCWEWVGICPQRCTTRFKRHQKTPGGIMSYTLQ